MTAHQLAVPPYQAQYADRGRISEFLAADAAVTTDTHFADFGFGDVHEYASWAPRLCAIACLRMALSAFQLAPGASMATLTRGAVHAGAYQTGDTPDTGRGWAYQPLLDFSRTLGLDGVVRGTSTIEQVAHDLAAGHLAMVSVHPAVIRGDRGHPPRGERGGHLVLAIDYRRVNGVVDAVTVHNPNGRDRATQASCVVPVAQFANAFTGRGLTWWQADVT